MKCPHCGKDIEDKTFILHWRPGHAEKIHGVDIADAVRKAGYGGGAINTLDYWEEVNLNSQPSHQDK